MKLIRSEYKLLVLLIALAALLIPYSASAGTSGKIAGTIYNAETGEPLAGATVTVEEFDITCVTDADGEYYLINVPVGKYTLIAQSLGYESLAKHEVRVLLDLTTPISFKLLPGTIQTDQVVRVMADRPLLRRDRTASVNVVTRDELRHLPNALSINEIVNITAGTVTDADGYLHVRGGRDGTNSYYFDGIPVQDPFYGSVGTRIAPDALEEIDVVPGGFSAEYGEALSSVISAMTQEGSNKYHGKLRLYDGLTKTYNVNTGEFSDLRRVGRNSGIGNIGGPVPYLYEQYKATFFSSTEIRELEGYLPHNDVRSVSQVGKLSFQPIPNMKINMFGNYYKAKKHRYVHRDVNGLSYDFNLDGAGLIKTESSRFGFRMTLTPRANIVMNAKLNHFESWTKLAPEHLFDLYWTEWPGYSEDENGNYNGTIDDDNYIASEDYFYSGFTDGSDFYPVYSYRFNSYKSLSGDILVQANKHHQVKVGAEYRFNRLNWDSKQFFNSTPYGEKYGVKPRYAAAYVQDKIELQEMVINAGLRFDYLNSAIGYWDNPVTKNNWMTAEPKSQISPRFGMSHPISDHTVIHFNYGLYFQVPLYSYMYTNLQGELNSGFPLVGNPNLEPEKTVGYELGVNHTLDDNTALKLVTYYKDISNLTTTQLIRYPGGTYVAYDNADYGSVKGLDIVLTKRRTNNLAGSINYSYMIARGNASYPYEGYYDYYTQDDPPVAPVREYPLAFDQRHTLTVNFDYRTPRNYKARLFGVRVPSSAGLNVLFNYGSGMPYTRTDNEGRRIGLLNEGRMPSTNTVSMKLNKDFYLGKTSGSFVSVFLEVENLFDRRNVINVYSNTGKPDNDGWNPSLANDPDGPGPLTASDVTRVRRLLARDPQNFDTPRQIRWGIELIF